MMVVIGGLSAAARWFITAQEPPLAVLAAVQLAHGLSFGLTQLGTMGLLVRQVPAHAMARGQGYYAACSGIISSSASVLSGAVYAQHGQGVYYVMTAMAASGAVLMWSARLSLSHQPHSAASGG
jgi:PPP family 3-phenylpropionic acid transporter